MGCGGCADRALYLIGEPIYNPSTPYEMGAFVVVAGVLYVSLQGGNDGHNPQEYPEWWEKTTILEQLTNPIVSNIFTALGYEPWDAEKAYSQNEGCQFNGTLYVSSVEGEESNTDNEPAEESNEFWGRYPARINGLLKFILDNMLVPEEP